MVIIIFFAFQMLIEGMWELLIYILGFYLTNVALFPKSPIYKGQTLKSACPKVNAALFFAPKENCVNDRFSIFETTIQFSAQFTQNLFKFNS